MNLCTRLLVYKILIYGEQDMASKVYRKIIRNIAYEAKALSEKDIDVAMRVSSWLCSRPMSTSLS